MKRITATTWIFMFMYFFSAAQDVTFSGSGCGAGPVSGTWTVPCHVTSITVHVHGAGGGAGGGGGGSNGGFYNTRGGGGGGGGGYSTITINVTPGSAFSYSAGAAGCGGGNGSDGDDGDNGSGGGASSFSGTDAGGTAVGLTANGGGGGGGGDGREGSTGGGGGGGGASGGTTNTQGGGGNNGSGGNGGNGGTGAGPSGGAGGGSGGAGNAYGGGGGGGGNSNGGRGAGGGILITYVTTITIPVPVIAATQPTCTTDGSSTISNYDGAMTYIFTPSGPAAGAGGAITGMVTGTSYTVEASAAGCNSLPSAPFINDPAAPLPVPVIAITPPTCSADGFGTISNYNAAMTYVFTPSGSAVDAGGVISVMAVGTNYTVEATDISCISAPSAPFSIAAQLPAPVANITGSLTYCIGANTTLTATGGISYAWTDAGGTNISNLADVTVTQGTYTVVVTDNNACTADANATVTELSGPSVTLTAAPMLVCTGQSVTFTADLASYPLYDFYLNGTLAQSGAGNTFTTNALIQGDVVTVRGTDQGCLGPESNPVSVTVLQIGTATVTLSAAPNAICAGQSVTFTATPPGYTEYEFLVNGVSMQSGATDTYITTTIAQGDVITARASDGTCFGPESNPVSITILQVGTAVVTLTVSDDAICQGQTVTFTADPSGFTTYEFLRNGSLVQTGPTNTYTTTTIIATDVVTAHALDQGCFGPESNALSLIINAPLTVDAGSDLDFCRGDASVSLQGFSPVGGTWSGNGVTISGVFDPSVSGTGQHTLTYSFTDANGCSGDDDIIATVSAPATADFSANPLTADVADNTPIVFTDLTAGAAGWLWDFGDESSSIEQHPSHLYAEPGTYTVTLIATDVNGCADTVQKTEYILIHDGVGAHVPNAFSPDNNSVNDLLQIYGKGIDRVVFRVYNRWGEKLFETDDINGAWDGTYNGKTLAPDVYVYTLYAEFLDRTTERKKGSVTLIR